MTKLKKPNVGEINAWSWRPVL